MVGAVFEAVEVELWGLRGLWISGTTEFQGSREYVEVELGRTWPAREFTTIIKISEELRCLFQDPKIAIGHNYINISRK